VRQKTNLACAFLVTVLLLPATARNETALPPGIASLSAQDAAALDRVIGSKDPAVFQTLGITVSPQGLIAAFYGNSRSRRLAALQAAGNLPDPWPVVDYLVSFLQARQYRAAALAAHSLELALETIARAHAQGALEVTSGQIRQVSLQLLKVAARRELSRDARVVALRACRVLATFLPTLSPDTASFLNDDDPLIRSQALAFFSLPLSESALRAVGRAAIDDSDVQVRGQAVGILCENALALQVERPSADLEKLMRALIEEHAVSDAVATLMPCLARLPYESRQVLTDQLASHPNPDVQRLWNTLIAGQKE
jgi:hypothetical protein